MNKIQLLATMTRDCELRYAQSGTAIGSFGVAYNEKRKQPDGSYADQAHFFDVTCFGKTAENVQKYFSKGSRILIDGSLSFSQWEKDGQKRSKVDIKLNSFDFIDRKSDNQQQPTPLQDAQKQHTPAQHQGGSLPTIDLDSEIPFNCMRGDLYV